MSAQGPSARSRKNGFALSRGERVARDGVFTRRRGPGEGSVAGRGKEGTSAGRGRGNIVTKD
jgi:hypothetical protein